MRTAIGLLVAALALTLPASAGSAAPGSAVPATTGSAVPAIDVVNPWNERFMLGSKIDPGYITPQPDHSVELEPRDEGAQNRRWYATPNIAKGGYYVTSPVYPGRCLDTAGADPMQDGAALAMKPCENSYRQSWVLAFDAGKPNLLRLVNYASKLVVTVTAPGTKAAGIIVTGYRPAATEQLFFTDNCGACG
jgi:hypothetical protein